MARIVPSGGLPTALSTDDGPPVAIAVTASIAPTMTERPRLETRQSEQESASAAKTRQSCPECEGPIVTESDGSAAVCDDCGLVIADQPIDTGPEWRAFDQQEHEQKSRVGAPTTSLIHDRGMSTTISWQDKDAGGNWLSPERRRELARLRRWDERFRAQDADDRNLKVALGEIVRMASALGLPEPTRETASVIYRRALSNDLLPGRSIEGMATASVYAAARLDGIARSIDEVAGVSRVDPIEIKRTYRYLTRELGLEVPPTDPAEYIARYASAIDCSDQTERHARELIDAATDQGLHSGKNPVGIAASAIYAAAKVTGEDITQADISTVADISEVTIRNRYQELLDAADDE